MNEVNKGGLTYVGTTQKLACVIVLSKGKWVAYNNHDSLQPFYDQRRAKIIVGGQCVRLQQNNVL
jgi:hypothetical protein